MTEPIRTDAQPTGPDRELAERIMRMYSRKSGWSGEIAELIAQHHAGERERITRLEKALEAVLKVGDDCDCIICRKVRTICERVIREARGQ